MKYKLIVTLSCLLVIASTQCYAQKNDDKKMILTVKDTQGLHQRIKVALVKNDFIVKEDGNRDTISTYPAELKKLAGYSIATVVVKGDHVEISGMYGLIKVDDFGYTRNPKNYKPISYFKGSKTWKLLASVADKIDYKEISYSK